MVKNSSTSNSKKRRWPWAFILTLVLFYVLQAAAYYSPVFWKLVVPYCKPLDDDYLRAEAMLRLSTLEKERKKVFIFGSSQARQDFDMHMINDHFADKGYMFYNLGVPGTTQPIDLFMAKEKLLSYNPSVIVYMPFIESFYRPYRRHGNNLMKFYYNESIIPYLLKYKSKEEIALLHDDFVDSYLSRLSFFYKYRNHLVSVAGAWARHIIKGEEPDLLTYPLCEHRPPEFFPNDIEEAHRVELSSWIDNGTAMNEKLFEESVRFFQDKGVKVIVLTGPTHPLNNEKYDAVLDDLYESFLVYQSSTMGFTYIPTSEQPYLGHEHFLDFTHLDHDGREIFTDFIISRFTEELIGKATTPNGLALTPVEDRPVQP